METGGIHKLIIGANIFSTKPLASKPRGCINSWLLDGRRPTQRKNQSVGYESKCPGLRLNFRQTFSCLERHFPFLGLTAWPRPTASARQPSDLGKESSSRGMKSLPSVLPRPGHLLSYPTERLFHPRHYGRLLILVNFPPSPPRFKRICPPSPFIRAFPCIKQVRVNRN